MKRRRIPPFTAHSKHSTIVVGAGSGKIMMYDIEAQRRSLSVLGHADDGEHNHFHQLLDFFLIARFAQ